MKPVRPARRFRSAAAFLLAAVCLAAAAQAGDDARPADPARAARERERIRRELDAMQERVVAEYLAEQEPGEERSRAELIVGALYETGRFGDGEPDPLRAAGHYAAAAEAGSADALYALGRFSAAGVSAAAGEIVRDPEQAREYFRLAAEAGSVRALVELGVIYAEGRDVDPDSKLALDYFTRAARHGDPDALERLEPVMRRAREWEAAKPGRDAGFPTDKDEIIDPALLDQYIDVTFNLQQQASAAFVELSRRFMAASRGAR